MPESLFKGAYLVCVGFALLILLWGAPRGCGVARVATAKAKKDPTSVRSGSRRTTYVIAGFGGK